VDKADAIRQAWLIHIRTFLGEWFLNLNIGVPYIQKVFAKFLTKAEVQRIFNEESLKVPGILRVDNVDVQDIDISARRVEVTVENVCDNVEGTVTFKYAGACF
jgi:aspartyl/asparaginyl-tRNA synthetase